MPVKGLTTMTMRRAARPSYGSAVCYARLLTPAALLHSRRAPLRPTNQPFGQFGLDPLDPAASVEDCS